MLQARDDKPAQDAVHEAATTVTRSFDQSQSDPAQEEEEETKIEVSSVVHSRSPSLHRLMKSSTSVSRAVQNNSTLILLQSRVERKKLEIVVAKHHFSFSYSLF